MSTRPITRRLNDAMGTAQGHGLGKTQPACETQRQDPLSLPSGLVTQLRAKHFKEVLNGLVQEEIREIADSWRPNTPNNLEGNLVTMIKVLED